MTRRKHVLLDLDQEVTAPTEGQRIVRALGSRGGNIVEVEYPDGSQTLCMMPSRFNKKLWVRRGGYLLIEDTHTAAAAAAHELQQASGLGASPQHRGVSQPPVAATCRATPHAAAGSTKVTGTIVAVLYEQQIKDLKRMPGVWPAQFTANVQSQGTEPALGENEAAGSARASMNINDCGAGSDSDSDGELPPLQANTNRKVIHHAMSSEDDDC